MKIKHELISNILQSDSRFTIAVSASLYLKHLNNGKYRCYLERYNDKLEVTEISLGEWDDVDEAAKKFIEIRESEKIGLDFDLQRIQEEDQ